jgi:hypothetical protein
MVTRISPHHLADEYSGHWNDDDKIEVFLDRIMGWQLRPAHNILGAKIPDCEIAVLSIIVSYFEMIAKYEDGFIGTGRSAFYFRKGLLSVFPTIEPDSVTLLSSLYHNLRCGLYHSALPSARVILGSNPTGSIGFNEAHDLLMVNVELLLNDIALHFEAISARVRNPENRELRSNVIKRIDAENKIF